MNEVATTKPSVTILSCIETDQWKKEVQKVIPPEIMLEAMLRVARSTATANSRFQQCDPRSFLMALCKCGRAGLYPDGREAHLIPFGKDVQAIFDWKGLVALAKRSGVLVTAKIVCENDEFTVEEDDGNGRTKIVHIVDYRKPRGLPQAVYSRAVQKDSQVDYEVMTMDEVEEIRRQYSRAAESDAWKKSFNEMAKKTVIKRHSKRWDMSPEIREAINSDDDSPAFGTAPALPTVPPKLKAIEVKATVTNIATEPEPEPETPGNPSVVPSIIAKAKASKIGNGALLDFIVDMGGVEKGTADLESAYEQNPEMLGMIESQWEDIAKRIHAQTNPVPPASKKTAVPKAFNEGLLI